MISTVDSLCLVPILPLAAAAAGSVCKPQARRTAASLAIGAIALSFLLSVRALFNVVWSVDHAQASRTVVNFSWLTFGHESLVLGWMLDPLTALMLTMVTAIALLVFIYSIGYMAHDDNYVRFFCFLSLFSGAMLGLIISNSLLLLFMFWEIVGLSSYLLIGFWFGNPVAAAAAKKAFIVTRIGDLAFFLGILWLYAETHTALFYNDGAGFLEASAIQHLSSHTIHGGLTAITAISLLIFCGAIGKSGQVPLHVWLPDAMEGPTPVSALIHAATMVAAGVFLVARVYPLMSAAAELKEVIAPTTALQVVTWVGAITALFGALVAVAQYDIKRILAYSTISQLGYMMIGLGVGGPAVGMFHLIAHAFFKALLFLGAGSVIHGCNGEQDIRRLGGLRDTMRITFIAYTIGMLALCGFPLFFSGFWSKDAILHAAREWSVSQTPFYMGVFGAFLTAFYMTRQMCYVFGGVYRSPAHDTALHTTPAPSHPGEHHIPQGPHESPAVMTVPLTLLAIVTLVLGLLGTPAWPWLQSFLNGVRPEPRLQALFAPGLISVVLSSTVVVLLGLTAGWWFYGRPGGESTDDRDILAHVSPAGFEALRQGLYVDALYRVTFVKLTSGFAEISGWLDHWIWGGVVRVVARSVVASGRLDDAVDTHLTNRGFDRSCSLIAQSGQNFARLQNGRVQTYLRFIGLGLIALTIFLAWKVSSL